MKHIPAWHVFVFAVLLGAAILLDPRPADADRVPLIGHRLGRLATRSTLNNLEGTSTSGGCDLATGVVPEGKVFAFYDVVCTVTKSLEPLPNDEKLVLSVIDGAGCSGRTVLNTTFGSRDGLRYSPNLPLWAGRDMSVSVNRTAAENGGTVQVLCTFSGQYLPPP